MRAADDAPIVKEDNAVSATNKTDHSEDSYVFCSSPPRQSNSGRNHSTVSVQESKEDKQENVRDLITRIKYIKGRLDRAESDHRKKRMLKAIICLQKRAKVLVKGLKKEKVDPSKGQKETSSYKEGLPCQELAENTELGSNGTTSRELPNNHVVKNQGTLRFQGKEKTKSNLSFWNQIPFSNRPGISMAFGTFSVTCLKTQIRLRLVRCNEFLTQLLMLYYLS